MMQWNLNFQQVVPQTDEKWASASSGPTMSARPGVLGAGRDAESPNAGELSEWVSDRGGRLPPAIRTAREQHQGARLQPLST